MSPAQRHNEVKGTVIVVGRRRAARLAVERLGLHCHELPPEAISAAAADGGIGAGGALAVIAATEAAVVPAARLRRRLGLDGNDADTAVRCTDKATMKQAIRAAGLRCAEYVAPEDPVDGAAVAHKLGLPLVVKTRVGSGSRGARLVSRPDDMPARLEHGWMAESFVHGTEMSVESLVMDGQPVFVNLTEYVDPRWSNLVPAPLDPETAQAVIQLNRQAIAALGVLRGMTHMETFIGPDGPVFGELAARPPGGYVMDLIRHAYGFDPWEAVIAIEAGREPRIVETPRQTAGVRIIHPGPGRVAGIQGDAAVRGLPGLAAFRLRLEPGDLVPPRDGTGQECGHALFAGSEGVVRQGLDAVAGRLKILVEASAQSAE